MQASEHSRPNQMAAPGSSTENEAAEYSMRKTDYSVYFPLVAIAGFFLAWIPALPVRAFDPDEFQHSHAAWCVFRGMLPYRDFFEHHTPWYYYALAPFYRHRSHRRGPGPGHPAAPAATRAAHARAPRTGIERQLAVSLKEVPAGPRAPNGLTPQRIQ